MSSSVMRQGLEKVLSMSCKSRLHSRERLRHALMAEKEEFNITPSTSGIMLVWGMKVKVESEKVGLKLNIQKTKIMASSPITSWEIDGETVETVSDFIFWGSRITVDGDYSHEIKRHLLL